MPRLELVKKVPALKTGKEIGAGKAPERNNVAKLFLLVAATLGGAILLSLLCSWGGWTNRPLTVAGWSATWGLIALLGGGLAGAVAALKAS